MIPLASQVVQKATEGQVYTFNSTEAATSGSITSATAYFNPNWTYSVDIVTVNHGTTVTLYTPFSFKVDDVLARPVGGANGGASVTVKNGTDSITNAIDLGGTDENNVRATSVDQTYYAFDAGDNDLVLTFASTEASTTSTYSCRVIIYVTPDV